MTLHGVVLYGPPASGKNTVTTELAKLDARFTLFERLRVSTTPKSGYRNITGEQADALAAHGQIIYENVRYGNRYIVDRAGIEELISMNRIPVVHLGQIEGVRKVQTLGSWLTVSLECSRETTLKRAEARGDADVSARLSAWDETAADLAKSPDFAFDVVLYTERSSPPTSASVIRNQFEKLASLSKSSGDNPPG